VEFNRFLDLGANRFLAEDILAAGCSYFAFITENMHNKERTLKLLFVDIFQDKVKFGLCKSTMKFDKNNEYIRDQQVKSIIYCTMQNEFDTDYNVKLLTQYQ